ncbi:MULTISPECIES: ATP-dependent helicase [unclassified Saccharopolyspora]|uniref:ATP-dependent helicase n=1 Tax=unclassified Saccharopolyspora TaxID=2646250 RepID=UPI001CD54C97|nr:MULTISPECIES: ATP-dependent helicase [unclassified Saccharopolyspora]MCA1186047.1 ATP-dependent helicase [Saccharopolyspora sp. 6T]MCA1224502.1 ATP-dependent helicase [Saccharopolyspora sp. 6M]MCA1282254.1 ATP-dependent helicase [Saccharopolyspora sp. 7B]
MDDVLDRFSPATRDWFRGAFDAPTRAQDGAWRAIGAGEHALVVAPTGSGKTLAAFLSALDGLATAPLPEDPKRRCRVLYVSPLKALAVDVERNLRAPLAGIRQATQRRGAAPPEIRVGMRTGDTPAAERRTFTRTPPDVLVTTPESLFLLLTSAARESLRGVEAVIVDEVHAVAGTKRGAHLALSLERLDELLAAPAQRIGLSATVRPVSEVSTFLGGGRPVRTVQPEHPKQVEVTVEVPVPDLAELGQPAGEVDGPAAGEQPRTSIWPSVQERVLDLVDRHRSTIVFANSRRLAERLTAGINELATERAGEAAEPDRFPAEAVGGSGITTGAAVVVARAHHGSMSKDQRSVVEEELKSGRLPCVVATSSLELGIDMGAVDLVVQVEAPPSVASGMQRVGRAGHQVGAVSRGVVFPKFRGDLVSCAVVAERMAAGLIESLSFPRNPLDVLAQQVVAMVAVEPWPLESLARVVRRAAPFAGLPDSALHAVLDMLAGRYPSEEFGELRARVVWDRVQDELRARPGAQRLAVTSGGTIPDRGLFTVTTPGDEEAGRGGVRVGELDEEMVYESRVGDTFLLGTSSWKVQDITHDRVIVVPAPGQAARMPFWKGDSPGRPLELGRALGAFVRELVAADRDDAVERMARAGLDEWARDNLLAYLAEQREATRHVPDDRTIVVERFRDELGDWRMVVHSPFGAQVNGPWGLAIGARLRERRGIDPQVASSDDGIVVRLADALDEGGADVLPSAEDVLLSPDEVQQVVTEEVGGSALFAARFRECAARALLLPRRDPGKRSPLWQQRQRSAQLLAVAAQYEQFPIVLEALRECVQDVYDVPGLVELMSQVASRRVRVVEVETPSPSPFARSLLFGYIGMFLYEADAPLAERRSAALSLDPTLLAELLGSEALRELLDPEVVAEVERQLQRLAPERRAKDAESAVDLLRFLGDLSAAEAEERGIRPEWLAELRAQRRVLEVRIAGEARWIAVEDAGKVRDALGVALPVGVPEAFTEPVADPLGELLIRFARCRGPFPAEAAARRFGLGVAVVHDVLDRLTGSGRLVRGELRPLEAGGGGALEYCDAEVLRRLRRGSLARLRAEVEPVEPAALGRFLPAWHGVGARLRTAPTVDDVYAVVEQLAGAPIPASALESLVLPARLPGYSPALLDELTSTGEVSWVGSGALAGGDGWIAFAPTDVADLLLPDLPEAAVESALHDALLSTLDGGAQFFRTLADRAGAVLVERGEQAPADDAVIAALWDLVWSGRVTNDTLAPLRALVSGKGAAHKPRRSAPRGRYARLRTGRPAMPSRSGPPAVSGRWSLAPAPAAEPTRRAHARAESFLERHGVLTRGALETERVIGGFSAVYKVLRAMEESGRCRRGYVVEGLGAAQFAVPGAIDRVRALSGSDGRGSVAADAVVLAAADPAQPYGAALPWPDAVGDTRHRPGRKAGSLVVLVAGAAVLYVERGGKSLLSFTEDEQVLRAGADGLARAVRDGWLEQLVVQRADGEGAWGSRLAEVLTDAGFRPTPKGLRLRA